jgi:glycine betaine/proline transport system ATP-binding protein
MQTIPTNGHHARDRAVAATAAGTAGADEFRMECREVYKIFDPRPEPALAMLRGGAKKDEVLEKLGVAVGVDAASFAVRPGEIFVVMGLSGSGKSTLVRLLNRLIEPSAGAVLLDGEDLTKMSARELIAVRRRDMSFVFQSFALMPHLSALENAAFGLALAGVAKDKRREAAMAALEKVGLGTYAERLPSEMSGGMQQRVGLARALAKNPSIMFMDEAFSALDPLIRTGCRTSCCASRPRTGARSSSSATTSTRPCASATASRSWRAAGSSRSARPPRSS